MLTSASPGRAAALVPIELKRGMGSSTKDRENLQHLQRRRLLLLAQRCGGCGTERSSEFGSVRHFRCRLLRAEARRFPGALRRSDLLEPPGRRCGCWRRRHLRFSEIVDWEDSGLGPTLELRRSMLTSASPGRGGGAGADRAKARYGSSTTDRGNLQHLQRRRLPSSLAQRCGGCGTERSSEFGSVRDFCCRLARARGAPISGSSEAERPARAAWSALRLLATSSSSF